MLQQKIHYSKNAETSVEQPLSPFHLSLCDLFKSASLGEKLPEKPVGVLV